MYGTLADFRTYQLARGNSAPTDADDATATAALQRGSDYIRTRYVLRMGDGEWDTNDDVIEATYIAAGLELATAKDGSVTLRAAPGFWQRTYTEAERKVLTKAGGLSWTVVGGAKGRDAMVPTSSMIDALLAPYMGNYFGAAVAVV